jgi:hypothetical protein
MPAEAPVISVTRSVTVQTLLKIPGGVALAADKTIGGTAEQAACCMAARQWQASAVFCGRPGGAATLNFGHV